MARVYLLSQPTGLLTHLYVVDRAVGNGAPNMRDDVLLVQFMLRVLMPPEGSYPKQEVFQPPGQTPLAIDGAWGTQTFTYIKAFQTQFNAADSKAPKDMQIREDGAINPFEGGSAFGKRFGQLMTLVRLNTQYSAAFGIDQHKRIDKHALFPRDLFGSLFMAPG